MVWSLPGDSLAAPSDHDKGNAECPRAPSQVCSGRLFGGRGTQPTPNPHDNFQNKAFLRAPMPFYYHTPMISFLLGALRKLWGPFFLSRCLRACIPGKLAGAAGVLEACHGMQACYHAFSLYLLVIDSSGRRSINLSLVVPSTYTPNKLMRSKESGLTCAGN